MNMLNNSVIICDPSPKSTRKKAPLGSKKTGKTVKKTYYESPLKHIKLSNKRLELLRAQRKLTRNVKHTAGQNNNVCSPDKNPSLQDSVIILSDNESDNDHEDEHYCQDVIKEKENNLCTNGSNDSNNIAEPFRKALNTKEKEVEICKSKKRKKSSVAVDNNSSCLIISDSEELEYQIPTIDIDGENIASLPRSSSQGSEDIVVVWSSTKSSALTDKEDQSEEQEAEQENNEKLFMIDCNPNPLNLSCLECTEEPPAKKRKKNSDEKDEKEDTSLPFSRAGLILPKAKDISNTIVTERPKSKVYGSTTLPPISTIITNRSATVPTTSTDTCKPPDVPAPSSHLREIVIDGNNIAMAHTNGKSFSEMGLKIVIDYFKRRGHSVKAFVPQYRRALCHPLLEQLYNEGTVVFTPSRNIGGRRITPYDDRFILQYATLCGGIVISSDQYRDLYMEKPEWRSTIENRLLAPTFVGDYVMFPEDPLGRNGPRLDDFLRY